MKSIGLPELLTILVLAALMFRLHRTGDLVNGLIEVIERFKGGGPGSPSHPVPADDSAVLRRRHGAKTRGLS